MIATTKVTHMTTQGRFITARVKQPGVTICIGTRTDRRERHWGGSKSHRRRQTSGGATSSPASFTCARRDFPATTATDIPVLPALPCPSAAPTTQR